MAMPEDYTAVWPDGGFEIGSRVKINGGALAGEEAEVVSFLPALYSVKVRVMLGGKGLAVILPHWLLDPVDPLGTH